MKTKNFKRVLTLVLALAMMLSLSMVAFAGNPGSVSVIVRTYDYETGIYTQIDTFNAAVDGTDNVYDVITGKYSSDATWYGTNNVHYLRGLTVNNVNYASIRYNPDEYFDEWDEYLGGDDVIDYLNTLPEFIACDGVYMRDTYFLGDGYYIMGDMEHMCSISFDWIYEVDFAVDGYGNFVYPPNYTDYTALGEPYNPNGYLWTMDQCELSNGDIVRLTYGLVWTIFE